MGLPWPQSDWLPIEMCHTNSHVNGKSGGKALDDGFGELPISGQKRLTQNFVSCFIIRQQKSPAGSPAGRWLLG